MEFSYNMLESEYKKAVSSQAESFLFFGKEILTRYAEYMLQYLEMVITASKKYTRDSVIFELDTGGKAKVIEEKEELDEEQITQKEYLAKARVICDFIKKVTETRIESYLVLSLVELILKSELHLAYITTRTEGKKK